MTAEKIKDNIAEIRTLFEFEYENKEGNVDPYYNSKTKREEYLLYYDGEEQVVCNIDDVMNTPFIAGFTLNEIAENIEVTAY